ncbi:MAG TPA: hypothetical protein VFA55_02675, partial [Candidatus Kapabacteria bacterium]|nr:hypothetical protein [Candidatus Kapabacteria bacterium]
TNINYTLPTAQGAANSVLTNNGAGVLSWGTGSSGWSLTGNSGTTPGTNFVGTTDANDLVFETNSSEDMRLLNASSGVTLGVRGTGGTNPPTQFTFGPAGYIANSSSSNQNGTDLLIEAGPGTGNSTSNGNIIFETPTAGGSSRNVQTLTEVMRITPANEVGIGTTTPKHMLHSVYSGTTDETAAVFGNATGSTASQSVGVWGIANNTNTTNTGTIGVLASGNATNGLTAGQTNVALQVNSGEFTMGRTTEGPSIGTDINGATGGTGYNAQGPSGVVELTLNGNLTTNAPTANTLQDIGALTGSLVTINNRYASTSSIILLNVDEVVYGGTAPDPRTCAWILHCESRAAGSFKVHIFMLPSATNATNFHNTDKIRIGYMIVNPSR